MFVRFTDYYYFESYFFFFVHIILSVYIVHVIPVIHMTLDKKSVSVRKQSSYMLSSFFMRSYVQTAIAVACPKQSKSGITATPHRSMSSSN